MTYIVWILCIFACYKISENKNRDADFWGALGILFGIFALIAILSLP